MKYNTFEDWFDELEGFAYRSERFWDDFDYASQTKDYPMIRSWMKTAWEVGYKTAENKFYGGTQ